jgi:hypothetical protein
VGSAPGTAAVGDNADVWQRARGARRAGGGKKRGLVVEDEQGLGLERNVPEPGRESDDREEATRQETFLTGSCDRISGKWLACAAAAADVSRVMSALPQEPDSNGRRSRAADMFMRRRNGRWTAQRARRQTLNPLRSTLLTASDFEWTCSLSYTFRM